VRLALQARGAGDLKGALMNLNFARSFEPDAPVLAELQAQLEAQGKTQPGGGK